MFYVQNKAHPSLLAASGLIFLFLKANPTGFKFFTKFAYRHWLVLRQCFVKHASFCFISFQLDKISALRGTDEENWRFLQH